MPIKIRRDIALINFRNLPLQEYDEENDAEIFYYPKSYFFYWIKLEKPSSKKIAIEFKKLIQSLGFKSLVILGQINKPWISKFTSERNDYKALSKTVEYFASIKIGKKFNGALKISLQEIDEFVANFYTITKCDSGFYDYYITDIDENLLFHIHYSGEIKILALNKEILEKLTSAMTSTKFVDALREGTDRI